MNVTAPVASILSGSWQWWQNRESVTLIKAGEDVTYPLLANDSDAFTFDGDSNDIIVYSGTSELRYTINDVKRFEVNIQDIPPQKQGGYLGYDLLWIIPKVKMPAGVTPEVADSILTPSGDEYVIQDVFQNGWKNWYRLNTRNLVLAYGLSDLISFWRPSYTNSGGTRSIASYIPVWTNLPGKIVEAGDDFAADLLGKRQVRQRYEIHSSKFFRWQPGDQIRDNNGNIFQILSNTAVNVITNYNQYNCEKVK